LFFSPEPVVWGWGIRGNNGQREGVCPRAAKIKEILFLEAEAEILLSLRKNVQGRDKRDGALGLH
jgi:hypothetical protein